MQHMVKKTKWEIPSLCISGNKNAQMKIQQMAFMLMAIVLFFVLVGMFVLVLKFSDVNRGAETLKDRKAMLLATKIANSPEFACGTSFGGSERTNCVDADKVMMLKDEIRKYNDFWGVKNIEIRRLYPLDKREIDCDLTKGTYPNCGIINLKNIEITSGYSNYVSLCRKEASQNGYYDLCELAIITINPMEVYDEQSD